MSDEEANESVVDFDFEALKKRKKKKRITKPEASTAQVLPTAEIVRPSTVVEDPPTYAYDFLLLRIFDKLREKNPALLDSNKKRFTTKPPVLARVGTKKTAFVNFVDMCKTFKRKPSHLLIFIFAELGTTGSIDSNNQLIIKGRYEIKQVENILRKYVKEFVLCHTCKSPDTEMVKETRLFFLQCNICGSRCSVSSIKAGFQAVTSKRAALKAK